MFDKAALDQVVFWTIPIWKDRAVADKILSKYKESPLDIFGHNRPIAELWKLPRTVDRATINDTIQALASGATVDYSQLKFLEERMRDALASIGVRGTKAEILIEQRSMNSATLSSVNLDVINNAWKNGLATTTEEDRESFTLGCLTAITKLGCPDIDFNGPALRSQIAMAKTLPKDVLIDGKPVNDYIASLEEQTRRTDTVYDRFFAEFQKAPPPPLTVTTNSANPILLRRGASS